MKKSQSQKLHIVLLHLYEISKIDKSVETERSGNGVIAGDKRGMTTNGYGIWGKADEKF